MKTNNNIPAYRFQGYTDAWELRKFGEVVYRSNLISSSKDLPRLEFEDINSGLGTLNKDISQKLDYRKGLEFNVGDVLFGKLRPYLKNWWYAEFKGIALGDFWNLKSDLWHSCFLYTYIQSNSFQLVANDTSGTKMPRSDWILVAESIAKFPSLPEQEAIGTFFSTLDQHITLHQRKLDTLKEQKKTYLKLLFPAKGQTKPALRFQGFEDDWKEMKLGEVLVEYNKKSEIENQFELLSSTNSGIEPRSGRVSGESNIGYKIIKRGMVVLSPQNLWLGNINYNAKFEIGIVSPSYKVFNIYGPNELFLATVLRLPQMFFEYAQASVQGASIVRRNLDLDLFGSILVQLPSLPEQEFIGTFFQTLDQEIAQVEDKLASLKEMKKTLLRKLFV
ncbi:restriction endonuclease subunit S [Streptococcus parasuis]|uniref:restriction endonuclease subunit S n=1 Tax=Streptococcus parasuis TaxID=1501662 RepID=UPI002899218F|nr:restriction endonuclease subunit S [Streptococcus parasuis]